MNKIHEIVPINDELPSQFADRLGIAYTSTVTNGHKKENGQFFTPYGISQFMGRLATKTRLDLKILDPGCGVLILSCSLIENLIKNSPETESIDLTAYETDLDLIPYTQKAIKYLSNWTEKHHVRFSCNLIEEDFVLANKDCFKQSASLFDEPNNEIYDLVISNPPYFKISKDDKRAVIARSIVYGQPNIYSVFLMTAARLLKPDGELIFITPRSFSSGNYFRAFRDEFFKTIKLETIHLFDSRRDAFNRDNILQETLIMKGTKSILNGVSSKVLLTHSVGIKDLEKTTIKEYRINELIDFNSSEKILHLPVNETDDNIIRLFKSWKGNLNKYSIQISTGPVVSFRATNYLFREYVDSENLRLVPLYQLHNTAKMQFEWPVVKNGKPQYIQACEETKTLLLPNKNYIFLRRFSAKDDKSRLVATPYFVDITQAEFIGVENHLNYIYRPKGHLDRNEILGLSALLNSNLFDLYFRTFNGNINVSATELREMPLPPLEDIKEIGNQIIIKNNFSQEVVDEIVQNHFKLIEIYVPNE
ncbi:MAG: N-6 DNA methylase [Candidatus Methanofastidiosa archaeon]|nr:N-6 DNA methylase [Candidatus Methanofastidiosa archaeon]